MATPNTTQSQKGKARRFFQEMQPTFAIRLPSTTKLEFLDENDPAKKTIVRKKAREWVNKNRNTTKQGQTQHQPLRGKENSGSAGSGSGQDMQLQRWKSGDVVMVLGPLKTVGKSVYGPFNMLPDIGRNYDHIINYFHSALPGTPGSDRERPTYTSYQVALHKMQISKMAESELTWVLWLYITLALQAATPDTLMPNTEELLWFYNKSLRAMQKKLKKEEEFGHFSDHLVRGLAAFTGISSLIGSFDISLLHLNALIRILSIRGGGDVLRGLESTQPWTGSVVPWCEFIMAAELVECPKLPYRPYPSQPLPENLLHEVERLTVESLLNLPPITEPLQHTVYFLHQITTVSRYQKPEDTVDLSILQPLYDAQYTLLIILHNHKETGNLSSVEVLLAEAYSLYIWLSIRRLPPYSSLCIHLMKRVMKALLRLLPDKGQGRPDNVVETADTSSTSMPTPKASTATESSGKALLHPTSTDNIIIWSLFLGIVHTAMLKGSEYLWFKGRFRLHLQAMGLDKDEVRYHKTLQLFPNIATCPWMESIIRELQIPWPLDQETDT